MYKYTMDIVKLIYFVYLHLVPVLLLYFPSLFYNVFISSFQKFVVC